MPRPPASEPGRIISAPRVRTMEPGNANAEAVAIEAGRIVAVGGLAEVRAAAGELAVEELDDGVLLPGFIDAHHHFSQAALGHRSDGRLRRSTSLGELLAAVETVAAEQRAEWICLRGYEETRLRERRAPRAVELERCAPGRPLLLMAASGHDGVLSESGLRALGWSRSTADPASGWLARQGGEPTGQVAEAAALIAEAAFRERILATGNEAWLGDFQAHGAELLAMGITRVGDAAVVPSVEQLYRRVDASGGLPLSVHLMPVGAANPLEPRFDGGPTGSGAGRVWIGAAKLFLDGAARAALQLSRREAAAIAPGLPRKALAGTMRGALGRARADSPRLGSDLRVHTGLRVWRGEELCHAVREGAERGFQIAQHAVGNEAIAQGLEAVRQAGEAIGDRPGSPRLEHFVFPRAEQIGEAAELGVIAVVQPALVSEYGDQLLAARLPSSFGRLPLRSMLDGGLEVVASSDFPMSDPSVLAGIAAAVRRRAPSGREVEAAEALSATEMLCAYTLSAARALGVEDRAGSIAVGKEADLVHLAADPTEVSAEEIASIPVLRTWVGGRLAHDPAED